MYFLHLATLLATTAGLAVGQVITCPGSSTPPAGSTLVHIGFDSRLNWDFVSATPATAARICSLLPEGVADGLDLNGDQVVTTSLVPFNKDGYTATVAQTYVPNDSVGDLNLVIHTPSSHLYNNPDANIDALMDFIDPSIPLV